MTRCRARVLILLLAALAVFPYLPMLLFGRPGLGFDYAFHHANVLDFLDSLAEGTLYPRWAASANGGYGAPIFNFYPPLPYYLASAAAILLGDVDRGIALVAALLSLIGCLSLFKLVRHHAGPVGAFVGAGVFAWMPYTMVDMYFRFSWAEICALLELPLIFLLLFTFVNRPTSRAGLALVFGLSALAATHLVTCLTFGPFLGAYILYEALRRRSVRPLTLSLVAAGLAGLVVAAFLLPVFFERHLVHLDHITSSRHGQYGRNFLFHNEVTAGYTPSSFKPTVALAAAVQGLLLLCSGVVLLLRRTLKGITAFLFLSALFHLYMTTALSEPVWRVLPLLGTIQFPWRICGAFGFLTAWVLGLAVDGVLQKKERRIPCFALLLVPVLVALGLSVKEIHTSYHPAAEKRVDIRLSPPKRSVFIREYIPQKVSIQNLLRYVRFDPHRRVVHQEGEAEVKTLHWTPHHRRLQVDAGAAGATLILPVFQFPGWVLTLDGQTTDMSGSNALNLIEVRVPAGRHEVALTHSPTLPRLLGLWVSLAGILLTVIVCLRLKAAPVPLPRDAFTGRKWKILIPAGTGGLLLLPLLFSFPGLIPHIVLITAPGLRADHAHFNGYERQTTPNLDFLALGEGVRFRRAYTPVPDPGQAAETLLVSSGLVAACRRAGYRVGAILGEDLTEEQPALKAAFPEAALPRGRRTPGAEVVARASLFVRQNTDRPFFLWIHLAETAGPYTPGPERSFHSPPGPTIAVDRIPPGMRIPLRGNEVLQDLAGYQDLYDEAVLQFDRMAGRFVNDVHHINLYDKTLLVIAGLSGADLGDGPTPLTPGGSIHEVQTAVFLVMKFPGNQYMGHAVTTTPVSLMQLAPTFTEHLHPDRRPPDKSLCRILEGEILEPEVTVRMPDGSARKRIFEECKILWKKQEQPVLLKRLPTYPWETEWTGDMPERALPFLLEGKR